MDVIEQVLTLVDEALEKELRKHEEELRKRLEWTICNEVSQLFSKASRFVAQEYGPSAASKLAYKTVKPVLDDCIDRLLRSE